MLTTAGNTQAQAQIQGFITRWAKSSAAERETTTTRQPWPRTLPEQVQAVSAELSKTPTATPDQIAAIFQGNRTKQVSVITGTVILQVIATEHNKGSAPK